MTWYRVKVYEAADADMERLVVDDYIEADSGEQAAMRLGWRRLGETFSEAIRRLHDTFGVSPVVNSHRIDSVAQPHTNQGE